jgi:hypothetical protein
MEYVSLLAGEMWTDEPKCTHPVLTDVARHVNDLLGDDQRQELLPLIPRLIGTADDSKTLPVQLAIWAVKQLLPWEESHQAKDVIIEAIAIAEAEMKDPNSVDIEAYRLSLKCTTSETAEIATELVFYGERSGSDIAERVINYITDRVSPVEDSQRPPDCPLAIHFLTGLLDEYDRLTGRALAKTMSENEYVALENKRQRLAAIS